MKDLYYEIEENGYHIYDKNNPLYHIYQYEPYTHLYVPDGTLEENAKAHIEELKRMSEPKPNDIDIVLDELEAEVGINE